MIIFDEIGQETSSLTSPPKVPSLSRCQGRQLGPRWNHPRHSMCAWHKGYILLNWLTKNSLCFTYSLSWTLQSPEPCRRQFGQELRSSPNHWLRIQGQLHKYIISTIVLDFNPEFCNMFRKWLCKTLRSSRTWDPTRVNCLSCFHLPWQHRWPLITRDQKFAVDGKDMEVSYQMS